MKINILNCSILQSNSFNKFVSLIIIYLLLKYRKLKLYIVKLTEKIDFYYSLIKMIKYQKALNDLLYRKKEKKNTLSVLKLIV